MESRIPFSVGFSYMGQSYQNKINLKDATLDNIEEAKNRAQIAGINVYFFATRGCGDPSSVKPFENLARETCGQIFALPKSSSDIASMKKVAKDLLGGTTCSAKGVGSFLILESGAFLLVGSEIRGNSACGIRNLGLWNLEYSSRNPESH